MVRRLKTNKLETKDRKQGSALLLLCGYGHFSDGGGGYALGQMVDQGVQRTMAQHVSPKSISVGKF